METAPSIGAKASTENCNPVESRGEPFQPGRTSAIHAERLEGPWTLNHVNGGESSIGANAQSGSDCESQIRINERPHRCTVCERMFRYKSELTDHFRTHSGEKPFLCSACGEAFSLRGTLTTHERIHTGEKPYRCTDCSKTFRHAGQLSVHSSVHSKERPFACDKCSWKFSRSAYLDKHSRVHTGETPYVCNFCGGKFNTNRAFKRHLSSYSERAEEDYPFVDLQPAHFAE